MQVGTFWRNTEDYRSWLTPENDSQTGHHPMNLEKKNRIEYANRGELQSSKVFKPAEMGIHG